MLNHFARRGEEEEEEVIFLWKTLLKKVINYLCLLIVADLDLKFSLGNDFYLFIPFIIKMKIDLMMKSPSHILDLQLGQKQVKTSEMAFVG